MQYIFHNRYVITAHTPGQMTGQNAQRGETAVAPLKTAFKSRFGHQTHTDLLNHMGEHTNRNERSHHTTLPTDPDSKLTYAILEVIEHGCTEHTCWTDVGREALTDFLISHSTHIKPLIKSLPSRGAVPLAAGKLEPVYPTHQTEIHVEIPQESLELAIENGDEYSVTTGQSAVTGKHVTIAFIHPTTSNTDRLSIPNTPTEESGVPSPTEDDVEIEEDVDAIAVLPGIVTEYQQATMVKVEASATDSNETHNVTCGFVSDSTPDADRQRLAALLGEWPDNLPNN